MALAELSWYALGYTCIGYRTGLLFTSSGDSRYTNTVYLGAVDTSSSLRQAILN